VTASALRDARWFTIQEAARHTGLSEPTLRYYEKIGLIGAVTRDDGSRHRRYDPATPKACSG
jgi:DNA-binding transcriptional MerR regulator